MEQMSTSQTNSKEKVEEKVEEKVIPKTIEEINDAFFFVEDTLERALMPWVTLNETARAIINHDPQLMAKGIEIGVRKNDMTKYGEMALNMVLGSYKPEGMPRLWKFDYKGIPITIRVIYRNWPFLERYDKKIYYFEHIAIPNPFQDYWKQKDLVV